MEFVSLSDFLNSCNSGLPNRSASDVYDYYNGLINGSYSVNEVIYDLGYHESTVYAWLSGAIPEFIKQVKALEQFSLLPFNDNAKLFSYVKELFLYVLFSGSIVKDRKSDFYQLSLSDSFDSLTNISKSLSDVFGVYCDISPLNEGGFKLRTHSAGPRSSVNSKVNSALAKLLVLAGIPLGNKRDYDVSIPGFVDRDSFVYYACKLRGRYFYDDGKTISGFYLWPTNELRAKSNMNAVLDFLSDYYLNFKGNVGDIKGSVSKKPRIVLDRASAYLLDNFLKSYKHVLPV